ncbi:hypothetical protein SDC9_130384 [bioreactor metagenome]|uniref:Uncharacterized protein n=1 Tax=bioreactor metagenome TaxID=1076179 RepID=A0A645D1D1_9ZZZZ
MQGLSNRNKVGAILFRKFNPQRSRTAAAAIVCATATQPQQDFPAAMLHRVANELTYAIRAGFTGVFASLYLWQPGSRGHFNHCLPVGQMKVGCRDKLPIWPLHRYCDQRSSTGLVKTHDGSLPAVRHRDINECTAGSIRGKAFLCNFTDFTAGQRPFEGI